MDSESTKRSTRDDYVLTITGTPGLFLPTTSHPQVIDSTVAEMEISQDQLSLARCGSSNLDHSAATRNSSSLAPATLAADTSARAAVEHANGVAERTTAQGPSGGQVALNKYGDIPNLENQAKRARRRKNRELRESDPGKYEVIMEQKKKRRDDLLREERRNQQGGGH
ncbi:hypothetical protein E8E14_003408 [Neopestalotiopsis sp. 37M]|nr:hypothetical protein E8E14_003408 [Neopestalotiopsis sp. 37M]